MSELKVSNTLRFRGRGSFRGRRGIRGRGRWNSRRTYRGRILKTFFL